MKYPMVTHSDCRMLADRWCQDLPAPLAQHIHWQGTGNDIDLTSIERAASSIRDLLEGYETVHSSDRDRLEGRAAPILYDALMTVEVAILDDPGFWRYLGLQHFWRLIAWREHKAFERGNHLKYVDGAQSTECVLTRMYLRVQALGGSEYQEMAWALPRATDFWRSHIFRVRTGTAPAVTRAFVRKYRDDRLNTEDLRDFAKRLTRIWTNIVLTVYDDDEAERLIDELWPR